MTNIPMRRVEDACPKNGTPGDFELVPPNGWNKGSLHFICPRRRYCGVMIRHGEFQETGVKRWGFNGDREKPTLTPSINCQGPSGCGWHGFIINGEMTNA